MPGNQRRSLVDIRAELVARLRERGVYRRWVLITALVGMFSTTFPVTLLTVALGVIAEDFGASETTMTWLIAGPMLASAAALPVLGKMGDIHGQRRVFLLGFAAATVVAALTSLAWTPLVLIGLRTVTQVIGSATQPTSMALIMRAFPPHERVKAMGWWSLVAAGAPAVGLAVGGPLVDVVGWRMLFVAQAVLAVIPVVVATFVLEEAEPTERVRARFDVAGAATMAITAGALMLALNQSADWGWSHPAVIAGLLITPLSASLFVRAERRTEAPLLPLEFLRTRNFTAPLISAFFAGATYMGGFVMTPFLMRGILGWSVSSVALLMLLRPLTYSLSSPVGGSLGVRFGERRSAIAGFSLLAGAMTLFAGGAYTSTVWLIGAGLVIQGLGNGIARPGLTAIVANAVPEADLGIASASQRMLQLVGNAFGIALLTAVYGGDESTTSFGTAYLVAFGLGIVAVGAATAIAKPGTAAAAPAISPPPPTERRTDPAGEHNGRLRGHDVTPEHRSRPGTR